MDKQKQIVILTHGEEGLSQACFAFKYAVTLQSMGFPVDMYLASAAAKWANQNAERTMCVGGYEPIQYYIDALLEGGSTLYVCCACYQDECDVEDIQEIQKTIIKGAECAGMSKLVELSLDAKVYTF